MTLQIGKEKSFAFHKHWYGTSFFLVIFACIVQSFVMQVATKTIANNLHDALLNKLMQAPIKFFDAALPATIKNLFLHDLNSGEIFF